MSKSINSLCAAVLLGFGAVSANAYTLSILPRSTTIVVGESVLVDVVASGLVAGGAPSLASYDIEVAYADSILTFSSVTFGTGLDVLGRELNDQGLLATPPGTVRPIEFSADAAADLHGLQGDAFTLFTLAFTGSAGGSSELRLVRSLSVDADGYALEVVPYGASVSVSAVPLPAPAWLLLSGLAGVMGGAKLGVSRRGHNRPAHS